MAGEQAACYGHLDYLENKPVISFEEERKAEPRGPEEAGPACLRCWPELFSHCATVLTCNEQCNVKRASAL